VEWSEGEGGRYVCKSVRVWKRERERESFKVGIQGAGVVGVTVPEREALALSPGLRFSEEAMGLFFQP